MGNISSTPTPTSTQTGTNKPSKEIKIFISKHEGKGKDRAENIARDLETRGYGTWLSQREPQKDVESMQKGVDECDVLLLVATPGIFKKDRSWVTHTEVKYAIDSGKAVVVVDGGISYSNKLECGHISECCTDVSPDFQPYARMIAKALERVKWHGDAQYRSVDLDKIEYQIARREDTVAKMKRYLDIETKEGACLQVNGETKDGGTSYDAFISHTQRNKIATTYVEKLGPSLNQRGFKKIWTDVNMKEQNVDAMKSGVMNSACVIAFISGDIIDPSTPENPKEGNAFFRREYCKMELRCAIENKIPIILV